MLTVSSGKKRVRTPEQMAKHELRQIAKTELASAKLPDHALVAITYNGVTRQVQANVTVNVNKGEILFNYGAHGVNRLDFGLKGPNDQNITFGAGGNIMSSLELPANVVSAVREKYGLSGETALESDSLEEGESTE